MQAASVRTVRDRFVKLYDAIMRKVHLKAGCPPLSRAEMVDLEASEEEFQEGKGKRFNDAKTLLAELADDNE